MKNFTVVTAMIILGAITRFLPHPFNFTAIAAIALFGGARFNNKIAAVAIPMLAMFVSDLFIGFHDQMISVYSSLVLISLIGIYISSRPGFMPVVLASLTGSVLFFLITNAAVWYHSIYYPQTATGLWLSYAMGMPFFRNALLGDLCFNGLLFGSYYLVQQRVPALARIK